MDRKNVALLGLGVTGRAVVERLSSKYQLYIYDEKISPREMVKNFPRTKWLSEKDIKNLDFAIKSPGIPPNNKVVRTLQRGKIPVFSDLEVFYQLYEPCMITVTGTNGKTTVTAAIEYLLKDNKNVYTGGNIGKGVFGIETLKKEDILLLECSSFQLHDVNFFHPKVAVITNITSDHLDWHGSIENYRKSKLKMIQNMNQDDVLVLNIDDPYTCEIDLPPCEIEEVSMGQKVYQGIEIIDGNMIRNKHGERRILGHTRDFLIPGEHNMINLAQSILAVKSFGIKPEDAFEKLKSFPGVPHRLEFVTTIKGKHFYNDSKGTNPDSTNMALKALSSSILLIAGGYDKKADFKPFFQQHKSRIKALFLMGETAKSMGAAGKEAGIEEVFYVKNMKEAVEKAYHYGKSGDKILLSPACASWDMYKNFEERGQDFIHWVKELESETDEEKDER
ncbi:MAG: UDP-N-acetylmuramoyl-L-alanine--D-glutamate ligase [Tissierellia bacterium]|nr:UDP-N-acetylmuramoyl-L-alanine--D-glutamate ligase [Tissierellia bacterium]